MKDIVSLDQAPWIRHMLNKQKLFYETHTQKKKSEVVLTKLMNSKNRSDVKIYFMKNPRVDLLRKVFSI